MAFPDRVFVIVVESPTGRDPDRMTLLSRSEGDIRLSPVFTTMQLAIAFLARAQELGYYVQLDYIFPANGRRLRDDFPGHAFRLDPSPEVFFAEAPA